MHDQVETRPDATGGNWQALAGHLLDSLGNHVSAQGHPTWVEIRADARGTGEIALEYYDTAEGFFGLVAPPECLAIGVVATGKVHHEPGPIEPPIPIRPGTTPGARMCCVVARDGQIGWRMRMPDGSEIDETPRHGRLLDSLHRSLELPTPPPPVGSGRLQGILWLAAVLERAEQSLHKLSWREVARLHPVAELLVEAGEAVSPDDVPDLMRMAADIWTWEFLRVRAQQSGWLAEYMSPDTAGWMDEGMFARWMLDTLPGTDELIHRVRRHVDPSTARRLAHIVHAAG